MIMKWKEGTRGFTLVEVLVSLVIISVGMLALGAFTLSVLASDNLSRQRTVATGLAEQELDRWFSGVTPASLGFASMAGCPSVSSPYVPKPGCWGWPKTINNTVFKLQSFDATPSTGIWTQAATLSGATATPGEIRAVTVYWQNKGKQYSVTVTHFGRMM